MRLPRRRVDNLHDSLRAIAARSCLTPAPGALVGDISVMTKRRWERDPRVGWPRIAAVISRQKLLFPQ